jgi:hypothetical protein
VRRRRCARAWNRWRSGRHRRSRRSAWRRSAGRSRARRAASGRSFGRARRALTRARGCGWCARRCGARVRVRPARASSARALARRRETFPSHLRVSSAPAGISSSGHRSCRCQRSRCWSWPRAAIRSSRWSTSRRMSSAAPSRCAPGRFSIPSLSAARATLNASIESDLPRSRDERRAPAMCFGATRTIRSPRAIRKRSSAPDTCRQSSIAHTRSGSSFRAQRSSLPKPPLRAGTVSSPRATAVSASTAPQVCVFLCVSVPITIIGVVPSIDLC